MDNSVQDGEILSESPKPQSKIETMDFPEAIKHVTEGKRITKLEWNDKAIFGFLSEDGKLKINLPEKVADWILSDGDLNGEDWTVLSEAN